jgi:predicted dehydrogenase
MRLTALVLGIGHWHAMWHVRALERLGHAVTGVWDHDPARAEALGRQIGCAVYREVPEALARGRPDLAVVTPRPVEAPAVMRAVLEAGVPALAEKPLGLRGEDVAPLVELERQRGGWGAVLFVNRLSPLWEVLAEATDGQVVAAHFRINNGPIQRYPGWGVPWMTDPGQAGGGCLRNLGIHGADAICQLAGGEPVEVVAARTSRLEPDLGAETYAVGVVRFGRGAVGVVEAGYNYPAWEGGDYEWRVSTRSHYLLDRLDALVVADPAGRRQVGTTSAGDRYERFVQLSLERLRAGAPPIAGLADCYRAARLVDRLYEAAGPPGAV